jgi:hypothetical protein
VATFAFAAVMVVIWLALMRPAAGGAAPDLWRMVLWIAILAVALVGFSAFARSKTDGEWKWRWGDKE